MATAIRTIVVLVFSWVMTLITGTLSGITEISEKTLLFLVLSGIATGASWLCYFKALQNGDVNKVVPIDKSSTILTILLALIFFHEGLSLAKIDCVCMIGVGTMLMMNRKEDVESNTSDKSWLIYAILSAVFASLTSILGKIGISGIDSNLDVLPAGPVPPNPNELLMSSRFEQLVDYARSHYDYVILDTAPLGMVSDSFLLTRAIDVVIYVARANYTNKASIEMLNAWIDNKRINVPVYLILNDVNMNSRTYSYRQYGSGKYGYGYASSRSEYVIPWYKRLFRKSDS